MAPNHGSVSSGNDDGVGNGGAEENGDDECGLHFDDWVWRKGVMDCRATGNDPKT